MADNTDMNISGQDGLMDWEGSEEYSYENDFLYDDFFLNEDASSDESVGQLDFSVEDTDEGEAYEDEEDKKTRPSRSLSLFASAKKRFSSRDDDDEDDDEDDDDEDEPEAKGKGFSMKKLFSRRRAQEKDYDYDYDDDPDAEEGISYAEPAEEPFAFPEKSGEALYYEEETPVAENYEEAAPVYEEAYAGEETVPEAEEAYDPFAALSYRAANPKAEESYDGEEYAQEYTGEYTEEAYAGGEYSEEEYEEGYYEGEDYDYEEQSYDEYDDYDEADDEGSGRHSSHASSGGLSRFLMPALAGVAVLALCAIAFATVTLLSSTKYEKAGKSEAPAQPTPVAVEQTAEPATAQEPASPEMETVSAATSEPDAESGVKAKRDADGRIVPDVGGAVTPARSVKLGTDDFAGSTMIGNSFVEGMNLWSDIDTLKYVCADGVNLDNMIGNYLYYVTVQNYNSVYLCLGLNEIGWGTDTFIRKYEKVIDYIRSDGTSKTKNATIYIVSLFPVEEIMETVPAESGSTISKSTILEFNERLKTMCEEKGCWYLDVYSALANDKGYLPEDIAADDHVHFEKTGYRIWSDYLRNHYVDEQILGE